MIDMENDHELKEKLLQSLIEKMEDIMGDGLRPEPKGLAVEVAAPDKAHLQTGLDKAKEVLEHAPMPDMAAKASDEEDASGKSDAERLAELMGDEEDDEDDIGKR